MEMKFLVLSVFLLVCTRQALSGLTLDNRQIVSKSWKKYVQNLNAVSVNNRPITELLGNVLSHNFSLPYNELRKGLAYKGSGSRLRTVVSKLKQGRTVKLGVVGGSITFVDTVDRVAWWTIFSRYVTAAFPQSQVLSKNGAIPATQASYALMCLELMVEEDVDIVFVEYILNDGFLNSILNNTNLQVYEKLLRRILNRPHKPAVVLMQVPARGHGPFEIEFRDFHYSPEDLYGSLAQYYDLSWLSMRDVYWRLGRLHKDGYEEKDFFGDFVHPGGPIGQQVMADLAVLLLQNTAVDLLLHPWDVRDQVLSEEVLPPPMQKGNYEPTSNLCLHGEMLKSVVISAEGFQFVNEGTTEKMKLGYVSKSVGSRLVIRINTNQPKLSHSTDKENVLIAYLKSYEHMGTALLECIAGCTCNPRELQGHHKEHHSQTFLLKLFPTPSELCTISITVQNGTLSNEHKVKITGVMMNSYSSYYEGSFDTTNWHDINEKNKDAITHPGL